MMDKPRTFNLVPYNVDETSSRSQRRAMERAAAKRNARDRRDAPKLAEPEPTKPAYRHYEAFALMWYGCAQCGHRERIWNSRDGVTPFALACPSCGQGSLQHMNWNLDTPAPDYKPYFGQRVWIDAANGRDPDLRIEGFDMRPRR